MHRAARIYNCIHQLHPHPSRRSSTPVYPSVLLPTILHTSREAARGSWPVAPSAMWWGCSMSRMGLELLILLQPGYRGPTRCRERVCRADRTEDSPSLEQAWKASTGLCSLVQPHRWTLT